MQHCYNWETMKPRSQKARGVIELWKLNECEQRPFQADALSFVLMQEPIDLTNEPAVLKAVSDLGHLGTSDLFVRPCPTVPRHGFVDSRRLRYIDCGPVTPADATKYYWTFNMREVCKRLNDIFAEAKAEDEGAELLIMQYIDARYNVVHTGSTLTIGSGNDGATSGVDAIVLPSLPVPLSDELRKESGVTHAPFIEMVADIDMGFEVNGWHLTQLRDGPEVSSKSSYIPHDLVVETVVTIPTGSSGVPRPSLSQWEKQCLGYVGQKGLVVWHPGGSMASHYAVHCLLSKIPIVCGDEPVIGQTLESTENADAVTEPSKTALKAAFREAIAWPAARYQSGMSQLLPLYVLHNISTFDMGNKAHVRLLGWGLAVTLRQSVAALWGERRYATRIEGKEEIQRYKEGSRTERYKQVLSCARFEDMLHNVGQESVVFGYDGWGQDPFSAGTGGHKWLQCSDLTYQLWNALCGYFAGVCQFSEVLKAQNAVINVAHNCAKLLTKFISLENFKLAADKPHCMALMVAPAVHQLITNPKVQHKRIALKFIARPVPSSFLVSPELKRQYKFLLDCGGDKKLARSMYFLPAARTGDSPFDNAFNFLREYVKLSVEKACAQLAAGEIWTEQIHVKGPWIVTNPWYNPGSPTNSSEELYVPDYNSPTTGHSWDVNAYETPEYLEAMAASKQQEGWYPFYRNLSVKWKKSWKVNSWFKLAVRDAALQAIESFIRWPLQQGKEPQLAA